jgi:zinc transport system permease protein
MFTLALAIGILIIPQTELLEALFGDISQVGIIDAVIAVTISVVAILLTKLIYKKLVLAMISEDLAISKGINVALTNLLYLFLVSLVVAIGIRIVGTLLVGFLVIVPAVASKNLGSGMRRYSIFSAIYGLLSAVVGVILSAYLGLPPGPMVVFAGITIFVVTIVINWRLKLTA